ncbi:MAG: hypothetical protein IKW01_03025 [Firmicutes bacterium]|nr:hypothetical protein [Bacillota bacterium]
MGIHYGPYVMYILSQLLQKKQGSEIQREESEITGESENKCLELFTDDETGAQWHKETDLDVMQQFCREGYAQALRHGHFLIGTRDEAAYIAVPGRFLLEDQPAGGKTGFTLWQPLRGGEELYSSLEDMEDTAARQVYGYWIAALDSRTLEISEA